MGVGCSIPEEDVKQLEQLIETTKFKKTELKRWYRKFKRNYPSGKMDKQNFYDLFEKLTSSSSSTTSVADHIFRLFDHNHDGCVDFTELMSTLSVTTSGCVQEKIEWIFDIYDVDGNGVVTLDELCAVVTCMQSVNDRRKREKSPTLLSEDMLEMVFTAADLNDDGKLSLQEFTEATKTMPELIDVLNT